MKIMAKEIYNTEDFTEPFAEQVDEWLEERPFWLFLALLFIVASCGVTALVMGA